eukprot:CAMPEP_0175104676 /NCGR_PEP_ID=MMETSP0086_2-20121207/9898_1 /TAXON_ID=136419 /ORGANISM="Unknown Unknown, Strain D1" /LENGTH=278 /DNA_ID=CAMNT_0016380171 /DNA_START=338 /DNA_END=1174 /DNA_ORIENTATION=-
MIHTRLKTSPSPLPLPSTSSMLVDVVLLHQGVQRAVDAAWDAKKASVGGAFVPWVWPRHALWSGVEGVEVVHKQRAELHLFFARLQLHRHGLRVAQRLVQRAVTAVTAMVVARQVREGAACVPHHCSDLSVRTVERGTFGPSRARLVVAASLDVGVGVLSLPEAAIAQVHRSRAVKAGICVSLRVLIRCQFASCGIKIHAHANHKAQQHCADDTSSEAAEEVFSTVPSAEYWLVTTVISGSSSSSNGRTSSAWRSRVSERAEALSINDSSICALSSIK